MSKRLWGVLSFVSFTILFLILMAPSNSLAANVRVGSGVSSVPQKIIDDLRNSCDFNATITILSCSGIPSKGALSENLAGGLQSYTLSTRYKYYNIVKTTKETNVVKKNDFICSVAKGETYTLSTEYNGSISASASGGLPTSQLGLTASISVKIGTSRVFSGPPEDSTANTREFRVKYYCDKGSYKCVRLDTNTSTLENIIGNWSNPTYSVSYSIDRFVQ